MKKYLANVSLLICACGSATTSPPSYPGPAVVLLGGGVYDFVPEPACSAVQIIHGIQGGYHIWGSVRARYIDFHGVKLHFTYEDPDTGTAFQTVDFTTDFDTLDPTRLAVDPTAASTMPATCPDGGVPLQLGDGGPPIAPVLGGTDGWGQALASTVFLPQSWIGCRIHACIDGHRTRMKVEVTDRDGRTASDSRIVVPGIDPAAVSIYCTGDVDAGIVAVDLGGVSCP